MKSFSIPLPRTGRPSAWQWEQLIKIFTFVFLIFGFLFFISASAAHAQSPLQPRLQDEIFKLGRQAAATGFGLAEKSLADIDIRVYIARIASKTLLFVGLIVIIFIIYSGALYMFSAGNSEKTGKAKKMLIGTVVGVFIISSSYGIVSFVTRRMVRASFENMLTQAHSCASSNGVATCCQEWNAFDRARTNVPGLCAGASTWSECGDNFSADWEQGTRRTNQAWENVLECQRREYESVGLPSNLFD